MVVSILTCVLGTALAVAINFATEDGAGVVPWVAVAVLTVLSALLALLVHKREPAPPPQGGYGSGGPGSGYGPGGYGPSGYGPHGYGPGAPSGYGPSGYGPGGYGSGGYGYGPRGRPQKRTVSVATVLVVLLLITGLTAGVAYGGWYATEWAFANESGQQVLVQPVSQTAGPLTVTVRGVEVTKHFTMVELTAVNSGGQPMSLPLYRNCQLNAGGNTMSTWLLGNDWNESVPPNDSSVGRIAFHGNPAEGTTTASLSFAVVFGVFEPTSITVAGIELRTPA